jgi:hypothetical protein
MHGVTVTRACADMNIGSQIDGRSAASCMSKTMKQARWPSSPAK